MSKQNNKPQGPTQASVGVTSTSAPDTEGASAASNPPQGTTAPTPPAASDKPAGSKKDTDPRVLAAKFAGVPVEEVFDFAERPGGRFVVVTRSGQKFDRTPQERAQDALDDRKAAEKRANERAARKAGR